MQCLECAFEQEKRKVTQKAFERALNISMYLMEEIDKLKVSGSPDKVATSRQEILNLLKVGTTTSF